MNSLGLKAETVSTQVVQRDRHAAFFTALALLAGSIERFCIEIRHLQRTEVGEVEERFSKGQKGSSAMPHKRNPILSENLTGIARIIRSNSIAAQENVALWHERDISHSSVERIIAPDSCILTDFMISRFKNIISGLVVFPEKMKSNLELSKGLIFSGTLLIELVNRGILREDAYRIVQSLAMGAWENGEDLKTKVLQDQQLSNLFSEEEIDKIFSYERHLAQIDYIFEKAKKA